MDLITREVGLYKIPWDLITGEVALYKVPGVSSFSDQVGLVTRYQGSHHWGGALLYKFNLCGLFRMNHMGRSLLYIDTRGLI